MSRLSPVLDPSLLDGVSVEDLARRSGISPDRLTLLADRSEAPTLYEIGEIAEALAVSPMYVVRERPAVAARRAAGADSADLTALLEAFDAHVAAFSRELNQGLLPAFPTRKKTGATQTGAGWARRNGIDTWDGHGVDPLLEAIEDGLRIPVLIWPVPRAPFGASLRLYDTLAIWVNSAGVPGSQQRFTLAHELGHILLAHVSATRVEEAFDVDRATAQRGPHRFDELQAQEFAAAVLYDKDRISQFWDGKRSPASVAKVAAGLGISFEAAKVALKKLFPDDVGSLVLDPGVPVSEAFRLAGLSEVHEHFAEQTGRKRMPAVLRYPEVLEQSLQAISAG